MGESGTRVWLTEISRATFEDQKLDELGTDDGLFLVLENEAAGRFDVLAKVPSGQAAMMLMSLIPSLEVDNGE